MITFHSETKNELPMYELSKDILQKVSFDPILFKKELLKAISWLDSKEDIKKLKEWCTLQFGSNYPQILNEVFA